MPLIALSTLMLFRQGEYYNNVFESRVPFDRGRSICWQAPVYTREIIKKALLKNTTSIVISHNHPGGSVKPSEAYDQKFSFSL